LPELPEVETTVRGIRPFIQGKVVRDLVVRERRLRWPVQPGLETIVRGCTVEKVERRAKYILLHLTRGGLLIHLGMSGSIRVLEHFVPAGKHEHFDLVAGTGHIIRFRDPRKFGSLLYCEGPLHEHPRLRALGVEPLTPLFSGDYLYGKSKARAVPVKTLIMDGKVVVGVGNIYSSEALFLAGIHPLRRCSRVALARYARLVECIREVLGTAIDKGGTTLQDFLGTDGIPGYFEQSLCVYGHQGEACIRCGRAIRCMVISQRSTFYCPGCQK